MLRIIIIIVTAMLVFAGCSSSRTRGLTHSLIETDVTLSSARPTVILPGFTITLLSIAENGTTEIRVVEEYPIIPITKDGPTVKRGEDVVTARVGESCYGDLLRLKAASRASGIATFSMKGCITQ